jgi:hypothetical protein
MTIKRPVEKTTIKRPGEEAAMINVMMRLNAAGMAS